MSIYTLAYISSLPYNDDFTRGMVQQILKNIRDVPYISADELAARCYVSPSALRNFVKNLGYDSYTEFKTNIKYLINHLNDAQSIVTRSYGSGEFSAVVHSIQAELDKVLQFVTDAQIGAAAHDLYAASRILLCANTSSHSQINFATELILAGKEVYIANLPKVYSDFSTLVNSSTAVLFIRSGQYGDHYSISYLADATSRGAKTIFISSAVTAADMRLADHSLVFSGGAASDYISMDAILTALSAHIRERNSIE